MRLVASAFVISLLGSPLLAEPLLFDTNAQSLTTAETQEFALGGSVTRNAYLPETIEQQDETPRRASRALSMPLTPPNGERVETTFAGITLFAAESSQFGRDAFRLGTAYNQGSATAGFSLTYREDDTELTRSELYFDYALTRNFSIGVSGIFDTDTMIDDAQVPQLGLNAAYATENGAFVQGGFADAEETDPIFGLSIGLRF